MKFHIMCCFASATIVSVSNASPNPKKATTKTSPFLVWTRGDKLEAVRLGEGKVSVLRELFGAEAWNISRDGRQLVFASTPRDVDFFNAGAFRHYVFIVPFNGVPQLLLAAYGPKSVDKELTPDFNLPQFDSTGRNLILGEGEIAQMLGEHSSWWISMYNIQSRKRTFIPGSIVSTLPRGPLLQMIATSNLDYPALSPDGKDIVCLASPENGVPPSRVLHFDLKKKLVETLLQMNERARPARYYGLAREEHYRKFQPQFAWHPTAKKIAFVGLVSPVHPAFNIFVFDLETRKLTRVSNSMLSKNFQRASRRQAQKAVAQWLAKQGRFDKNGKPSPLDNIPDDFSPQWSPDGKQLFWIRGNNDSWDPKPANNQIICANADGSNQTLVFPHIKGMTQIQLLPKLADWSRYRNLSMVPFAGEDK